MQRQRDFLKRNVKENCSLFVAILIFCSIKINTSVTDQTSLKIVVAGAHLEALGFHRSDIIHHNRLLFRRMVLKKLNNQHCKKINDVYPVWS